MDECDSLSIDYRDSTNEKGGSGSKVTQTTRPPGAARAAAFGQTAAGKNGLKRMMQRFGALILLLSMLCGCAREKQVTSLCVPGGEQAASSNEEAAPEANGKTTQETENGQTRHLEYASLPLPGDLQLATALTAAFLRQIRLLIPASCREKVRIAIAPDFLHEQTVLAARCIIFLHLGTIIVAAAMALTAWKEASSWNIPSAN